MTDEKIIDLVRKDESDTALNSLYRHFPLMLKMLRNNGAGREDAEDIFQEALIILCRKAKEPGFMLTSRLSTYLFSICRFLWKDELKKRKHFIAADFETGFNETEEQQWNDILELESRAKLAEQVLDKLGDRCRELLLLFYKAGIKLKDIASHMGYSSENTAKNQKYKCLEGAKNRLKELKQTTQTF
jgi:RNA polymerase sigma factor (sigma-70 family)